MIVCLCRAKTDRDVLQAIEDGAGSVADLQRCGIGTECGSCHNFLRKMLAGQRSLLENCAIIPAHAGQQEDYRHPQ